MIIFSPLGLPLMSTGVTLTLGGGIAHDGWGRNRDTTDYPQVARFVREDDDDNEGQLYYLNEEASGLGGAVYQVMPTGGDNNLPPEEGAEGEAEIEGGGENQGEDGTGEGRPQAGEDDQPPRPPTQGGNEENLGAEEDLPADQGPDVAGGGAAGMNFLFDMWTLEAESRRAAVYGRAPEKPWLLFNSTYTQERDFLQRTWPPSVGDYVLRIYDATYAEMIAEIGPGVTVPHANYAVLELQEVVGVDPLPGNNDTSRNWIQVKKRVRYAENYETRTDVQTIDWYQEVVVISSEDQSKIRALVEWGNQLVQDGPPDPMPPHPQWTALANRPEGMDNAGIMAFVDPSYSWEDTHLRECIHERLRESSTSDHEVIMYFIRSSPNLGLSDEAIYRELAAMGYPFRHRDFATRAEMEAMGHPHNWRERGGVVWVD